MYKKIGKTVKSGMFLFLSLGFLLSVCGCSNGSILDDLGQIGGNTNNDVEPINKDATELLAYIKDDPGVIKHESIKVTGAMTDELLTQVGEVYKTQALRYISFDLSETTGLTKIPNGAFEASDIEKLVLPEGITEIGQKAFNCCTSLKEITIPDTVKKFGDNAFTNCFRLSSIKIPQYVRMGEEAFVGCGTKNDVGFVFNIDPENTVFSTIEDGKALVDKENTTLYFYPGASGVYEIPSTIKTLKARAFSYSKLKEITIPESVKTIETCVFACCDDLEKATVNCAVTGEAMFNECKKFTTITFSNSIKRLSRNLFYSCKLLEEVVLPQNLEVIEPFVFSSCTKLAKVTYPENTTWESRYAENSTSPIATLTITDPSSNAYNLTVTYGSKYIVKTN